MSIDRGKRSVLGIGVSLIDYDAAVQRITSAGRDRRPLSVSALAVHGVMTGALDPAHKYRLNRIDVVAPDGQPVRWALRLLYGEQLPQRVYGPVLTQRVCAAAAVAGLPVYLYGSTQEVITTLAARLSERYPGLVIAGCEPSRFRQLDSTESSELDARVRASGAAIMLVGLGCPRQEVFAYEHAQAIGIPVLAVGAAFDFGAGRRQAPAWMQNAGLEWLFRLLQEPRRLWRRYLLLNPYYCVLLAAQKLGLLSRWFERESTPQPLNYG